MPNNAPQRARYARAACSGEAPASACGGGMPRPGIVPTKRSVPVFLFAETRGFPSPKQSGGAAARDGAMGVIGSCAARVVCHPNIRTNANNMLHKKITRAKCQERE